MSPNLNNTDTRDTVQRQSGNLRIFSGFLLTYVLVILLFSDTGAEKFSELHRVFDASNGILSLLLALFLLSEQYRIQPNVRKYLAIGFGFAAATEIFHALIGIELSGWLNWMGSYSNTLRPTTWPPSAYVLPVALAWTYWLIRRNTTLRPVLFAGGITLVTVGLYLLSLKLPNYMDTGILGIQRPTQAPLLLLLLGVIMAYWRERHAHPLFEGIALMAVLLFLSDLFMLFSSSPHEKFAMMAHAGKFIAYILLHTIQMRVAAEDSRARALAEQALIASNEEANRANRAKSEFLSSMSHELRTPMNAILGFSQLMQYDENLSAENRDHLQEILKAGEHLLGLINEVLDLAKVESGRIELLIESVELCSVMDDCLNIASTLAAKRDIKIGYTALRGAVIRADRMRLKQAILNLLSNAIKYNRIGGNVKVKVNNKNSTHLRIDVEDTGSGIPAARMGELFQPFNRLSAENSGTEGTGIGLTITRRIIELMGGTVEVESEVGVGSTFSIEIPLESINQPVPAQKSSSVNNVLPEQNNVSTQHTLLYIEDNPANLRLVAQIFSKQKNFKLLSAHTPELGIELAQVHHPDLILLDINLPGMDGYQVLKALGDIESIKNVPVIAVTANAMPSDVARGKAAGFAAYITKPLDVALLLKVVEDIIQSKTN